MELREVGIFFDGEEDDEIFSDPFVVCSVGDLDSVGVLWADAPEGAADGATGGDELDFLSFGNVADGFLDEDGFLGHGFY